MSIKKKKKEEESDPLQVDGDYTKIESEPNKDNSDTTLTEKSSSSSFSVQAATQSRAPQKHLLSDKSYCLGLSQNAH